jgi:hypothetical protein
LFERERLFWIEIDVTLLQRNLDAERAPRSVEVVEVRVTANRTAQPAATPEPVGGALPDASDREPPDTSVDYRPTEHRGRGD